MEREFRWPERMDLANTPTPIVHVPALSDRLGRRVFLKRDDLTGCAASGNKIRKLEFLLPRVLAQGADTVITVGGLQSNHCRATAVACRQLGLEPHLVLRGEKPGAPRGNYLMDLVLGARVRFVTSREYRDSLPSILESLQAEYADRGRRAAVIPVGGSNGLGCLGYVRCAREIADFCREQGLRFDRVYHAAGSGGTTAGLAVGAALYDLGAEVVGVNVGEDPVPFLSTIHRIIEEALELLGRPLASTDETPFRLLDGFQGRGYGYVSPELAAETLRIARSTGVMLDPVYTAKAMAGLWAEERGRMDGDNVLFVHTGGIFGLLALGADLLSMAGDPPHDR